MRNLSCVWCLLAVVAIAAWGCNKPADNGAGSGTNDTAANGSTDTVAVASVLCGKCGETKGSEACCVEGTTCADCGLHAGTKLCCAELADDAKGQDICAECGHVAADGHECDGDCEACADCGLHKGSPACCKLKS